MNQDNTISSVCPKHRTRPRPLCVIIL